MDAKLQTLLHAYGEPLPTGVPPQPIDDAEAARLAEVRTWLDARPKSGPDAAVLDVIFRAAAHNAPAGVPQPGVRHDRVPVRHAHRWRRTWMVVGLTCSLAIGGFALALTPRTTVAPVAAPAVAPDAPRMIAAAPSPLPKQTSEVAPAPTPAPSSPAPTTVAAPPASASPAAKAAPAAAPAKPTRVWTADDSDDHLEVAKARAERLRARLDSGLWDAPAVTLTLPSPSRGGRFSAVSSQQ